MRHTRCEMRKWMVSLALGVALVGCSESTGRDATADADTSVDVSVDTDTNDTMDDGVSSDSGASADPIQLPLEIVGPDEYTKSIRFNVADANDIERLYLKLHRAAYRDAGVMSGQQRGPKASVRLNGGSWIGLTNETVTCRDHEASYGCINGAYHTLRLTLPISGVEEGLNTLSFRFNGTDGITSGYRVLDLDLVRSDGSYVLDDAIFVSDDPQDWEPPISGAEAVEAGRTLWREAELDQFPGGPTQRATCSGCHASDGADLEYFAYSNWSIVERAKFHGLSQREGEQIASYIRSNEAERYGRPWNPPYQPGPGLVDKPAEQWAAGAGVDAVLEADSEMLEYIFPDGISSDAVAHDTVMNVRVQPIAIQLPDWNAWLTNNHPVDVWGDYFLDTDNEDWPWRSAVLRNHRELRSSLDEHGGDALAAQDGGPYVSALVRLVRRFSGTDSHFLNDESLGRIPSDISIAQAERGLRKWQSVKLWSVFQGYEIQDLAEEMYGAGGEPRSWAGASRTVFDVPPHISGTNGDHFDYQTLLGGKYDSTAWYHLQFILDSGNGDGGAISPVDWNYHPAHIQDLSKERVGGPSHPLRMAQAYAKMLEQQSLDRPLDTDHLYIHQLHPYRFRPTLMGTIDDPEQRAAVQGALLGALMDKFESHSIEEWNLYRQQHLTERNNLKSAEHVPQLVEGSMSAALHGRDGRWVDGWYTLIPRFRADGVDEEVLERMIGWGEQMWPNGDWDAIRPGGEHAAP